CGRFITHLFACLEYPSSSSGSTVKLPHTHPDPRSIPQFIAYTVHQTKLLPAIFATSILLQRLKSGSPSSRMNRATQGHSSYVVA
ncbi:hypothetical protein BU15DRAFT_12278, partial [Melanogaster broomeanus]